MHMYYKSNCHMYNCRMLLFEWKYMLNLTHHVIRRLWYLQKLFIYPQRLSTNETASRNTYRSCSTKTTLLSNIRLNIHFIFSTFVEKMIKLRYCINLYTYLLKIFLQSHLTSHVWIYCVFGLLKSVLSKRKFTTIDQL